MLKECRSRRYLYFKFVSPARGGVPDRIIISPGATIFVELKRPGEKPDPRQLAMHLKMRRHGATVFVASTRQEVDEVIAWLDAQPVPASVPSGTPTIHEIDEGSAHD